MLKTDVRALGIFYFNHISTCALAIVSRDLTSSALRFLLELEVLGNIVSTGDVCKCLVGHWHCPFELIWISCSSLRKCKFHKV